MGLLMKMAKYSVKMGLGYFAVGTKDNNARDDILRNINNLWKRNIQMLQMSLRNLKETKQK
mgnify:CR=1 FL=1